MNWTLLTFIYMSDIRLVEIMQDNVQLDLNRNVAIHTPYGNTVTYMIESRSLGLPPAMLAASHDPKVRPTAARDSSLPVIFHIWHHTTQQIKYLSRFGLVHGSIQVI